MIIKKQLETSVELGNDAYTPDLDAVIIDKFLALRKGKCYQGVLITGVDQIVTRTPPIVSRRDKDAGVSVSVSFVVVGIVYAPGEVIMAKVINIDTTGGILLKAAHASVHLRAHEDLKTIGVGDEMPVYVMNAHYEVGEREITVLAIPFVPRFYEDSYLIHPINAGELEAILPIVERARALEAEVAQLPTISEFRRLLVPEKAPAGERFSLYHPEDISGVIARPAGFFGQPACAGGAGDPREQPAKAVIEMFLNRYIGELETLRILAAMTPKQFKDSSHIWKIYTKYTR